MRVLHWFVISFFLFFAAGCGFLVHIYSQKTIDVAQLEKESESRPSIVLDDAGNELFRYALDKRSRMSYDAIPEVVVKAFLAAEDRSFFSHAGLCVKGIIRSFLVNLYYRRVVQGASTITQQVARLLFLSHERTFLRKIHEVVLALQLERQLTKQQILELYLNNVYFGRGIYGIEAAVQRFWGKSVRDVTLDEAAMLAAVAKSARFYSPLNAPLMAQRRRNTILQCMKSIGFINDEEFTTAKEKPLKLHEAVQGSSIRMYIQEWIRTWAEQQWGKDALYNKGLVIQSTINVAMQDAAEKSFAEIVTSMRATQGPSLNGGMVVLDAATGRMKVMVGGLSFIESQFNRAVQASRQIGSSIKPILYALALSHGYDMDDVAIDEPIEVRRHDGKPWRPRNWHRKFDGPMTFARALITSNNTIAVKILLTLGASRLNAKLECFGIKKGLTAYPTSALGTAHASVKENAAAFNVFINNGMYVEPHMIEAVKNAGGKTLWRHKIVPRRVLDSKVSSKIVKVLLGSMKLSKKFWEDEGWVDSEAIGKTGSTNGAATVWFVGGTPEYTTALYLGRDDNKPLGRMVYASKTAFPIWLNFAKQVSARVKNFYFDPKLEEISIDWRTGKQVDPEDKLGIISIFK